VLRLLGWRLGVCGDCCGSEFIKVHEISVGLHEEILSQYGASKAMF
jgi:hypothetical protein